MHDGDPVGEAHRLHLIVGEVDRGGPAPLEHALELGPHLQAQQRIEIGQRLVHEQNRRADGEGACHRHKLALPARELAGIALEQQVDVHEGRRSPDAPVDRVPLDLLPVQAEADVPCDGHVREDGVVLEHHGDAAGAAGKPATRHPPPADRDLARGRRLEAGDDAQERGLAATRCTEQDQDLAVTHREVERVQGGVGAEAFLHGADRDVGHGLRLPSAVGDAPEREQVLADEEEKGQRRHDEDEGAGELQRQRRDVEARQQERRRGLMLDREDRGREDLVPGGDKGEHARGGDAGQRQRQHDEAEGLDPGAAQRPPRLLELDRDAREEREGDQDRERQCQNGVDQRKPDDAVVEADADVEDGEPQGQERQRRPGSSGPGGGKLPLPRKRKRASA